jgi:hypothetical protein
MKRQPDLHSCALKGNIIGETVIIFPGTAAVIAAAWMPVAVSGITPAIPAFGIAAMIPAVFIVSMAAAQKLYIVRNNFNFGTPLAGFPILPPFLAEFPVHADLFTLQKILIQGFPLAAPENHIKKTGFINPVISILLFTVYGNGKFTNRCPSGCIFEFGVSGKPPD